MAWRDGLRKKHREATLENIKRTPSLLLLNRDMPAKKMRLCCGTSKYHCFRVWRFLLCCATRLDKYFGLSTMNESHIDIALSPRDRLMNGFASAIAEKGYIETTIADIVRHARVSKRTFYQHFVDKKDCLLYCYYETSLNTLTGVQAAVDHARDLSDDLQQHIQHGITAFLTYMRAQPRYMQILMSEVLLVDQNGIQLRRDVMNRFSHLLQSVVMGLPFSEIQFDRQPPLIATAMVGAINELVLVAFEHNQAEMFDLIQDTMQLMLSSLLPQIS